jgi:hypothetical protein
VKLSDYQELLDQTDAHEAEKLFGLARALVADVATLVSDSGVTMTELIATWDTRDILILLIAEKLLEDNRLSEEDKNG